MHHACITGTRLYNHGAIEGGPVPIFTSQFTDDDNASQLGGPEEDQMKLLWETMLDIPWAACDVGLEPTS